MIPGFGAHYRIYRLAVALDRLRSMPAGTRLPLRRAAHMLGVSEATIRTMLQRYGGPAALEGGSVEVGAFRRAVRQVYEARKQR